MPTMVVLSLASLSLLAVLVLVLAIYLSNSKRLYYNHLRSHGVKARINGGSSCQTCRMCGGLRFRSSHASDPAAVYEAKSPQSRSSTHLLVADEASSLRSRPPQDHWAAMKVQMSSSIKQAVHKLISHQKRQTQGDMSKRLANLCKLSRWKSAPESKASCLAPACASTAECSSASSASSASSCLDSSGIVSHASDAANTDLSVSSTSTSLPPLTLSSESNSSPAIFDMVRAQSAPRPTDIDPQGSPFHRLVLEILVSPSGKTDARAQNSCSSAPKLTLKLETNATLEHLASCAEALKSEDAKQCEHTVSVAHVRRSPGDALSKTSSTLCESGDRCSPMSNHVSDKGVLLPDAGTSCSNFCPGKLSSGGKPILDTVLGNRGCCDGSQMGALADVKDCGQCGHCLGNNSGRESFESFEAMGKHSTINGQLKLRIGNHMCKKAASDTALRSSTEVKEGTSVSEAASLPPMNGLGSLRITFLKSDAECKLQDEGADKTSSQVGSPLASLNVTGNMSGGSGLSNTKKEKLNNKSCVHPENSCGLCPKSAIRGGQGTESISRKNPVEGEEHPPLQALADTSPNGDFGSSSKKEKKKKKNRGKKQKVKSEALVPDAQEMQEIGKVALEAVKHVSAVPEREIGCVCGAFRGDLHTESCPYPFTSSGSMLQRKIKEQYNHLVRSNAAKTLTLAQVGQFTTCLVEAKATLQQKSESIQRKFTIAKSLLLKADKSSFDRLCGQIYGLEMEQKKLEEDTVVYNRLQEQLKLSPAYKKMLEYGRAHFELQPHTGQMIEKLEPEDSEMSFEELLAQEKKDAFWQRHSLARAAVPAS